MTYCAFCYQPRERCTCSSRDRIERAITMRRLTRQAMAFDDACGDRRMTLMRIFNRAADESAAQLRLDEMSEYVAWAFGGRS